MEEGADRGKRVCVRYGAAAFPFLSLLVFALPIFGVYVRVRLYS